MYDLIFISFALFSNTNRGKTFVCPYDASPGENWIYHLTALESCPKMSIEHDYRPNKCALLWLFDGGTLLLGRPRHMQTSSICLSRYLFIIDVFCIEVAL